MLVFMCCVQYPICIIYVSIHAHFQRYDAGCFFLGEVHGKSHPAVASRKGLESLYWRRKVKRRASDKNYLLVLNPA